MRRVSIERLARNRMADVSAAAIHVDPHYAAKQAFVDDLVIVAHGIVADGQIKESIFRMEEYATAVMPDGLVGEIDEDLLGTGNRDAIIIERKARQAIMIGVWQDWIGPAYSCLPRLSRA